MLSLGGTARQQHLATTLSVAEAVEGCPTPAYAKRQRLLEDRGVESGLYGEGQVPEFVERTTAEVFDPVLVCFVFAVHEPSFLAG